ncbi:hypothetical protein GW17_00055379 [Ensete ventricosum]|nr:hypothetical protein GW17_00055379 [Ensete ventricosum]
MHGTTQNDKGVNRVRDYDVGSNARRRQPHQAAAARRGSRVQQRPRKRWPRMPPAAAHGGNRVQRPRKRRPRAPAAVAPGQRLAATQVMRWQPHRRRRQKGRLGFFP